MFSLNLHVSSVLIKKNIFVHKAPVYVAKTVSRTLNIFLTLTQPAFEFTQKRPLSDISYQRRTWFDSESTQATVFLGLKWTGSFFVWRRCRKLQKQRWLRLNLQRWLSFHLFQYLRMSLSCFQIWALLMLLLVIWTQLFCCGGVRWWKSATSICSMGVQRICSMSGTSILCSMSATSICSKVAESISSQIPEFFQLTNSARLIGRLRRN